MSAKRHIPYVNEAVSSRDFKYYIFDWDDNILHMPTKIRMERLQADGSWKTVEVSTSTFSVIRTDTAHYRAPGGVWAEAFRNFEDQPGKNTFIEDTVDALVAQGAAHPSFRGVCFHLTRHCLLWFGDAESCRSAYRNSDYPSSESYYSGFRLCCPAGL